MKNKDFETIGDCALEILKREQNKAIIKKYQKNIFKVFIDELYAKYNISEDNVYITDCFNIDWNTDLDIADIKILDTWEVEEKKILNL